MAADPFTEPTIPYGIYTLLMMNSFQSCAVDDFAAKLWPAQGPVRPCLIQKIRSSFQSTSAFTLAPGRAAQI